MRTHRALVAGTLAAGISLAASASGVAHPVAEPLATGIPSVDAANALIAEPWQGLAAQTASDARQGIKDALEGRAIVNGSGSASYRGQKIAKWTLELKTSNITGTLDLAAPPGLRSASLRRLILEAPLDGRWSFRVAGRLSARAAVKVGGRTLFSWSPSGAPFGLRIDGVKTTLNAKLESTGPLDGTRVPRLLAASMTARMTFGGNGFLPTSVPVQFTVRPVGSTVEIAAPIANVPLDLGSLGARFTGQLVFTVLPLQTDLNVPYPEINQGQITGLSELGIGLQFARVALRGSVTFRLGNYGQHSSSLELGFPVVLPAADAITKARALLTRELPIVWGETTPIADPPVAAPATTPFTGAAGEIESGIVAHLLSGQVLSIDSPQNIPPVVLPVPGQPKPTPTLHYSVEADTALWTGHYLAAEAFRYASTSSPAALERVKTVLGGVQRLFDVTTDAVVANGRATPVAVPGPHGYFARVAWPSTSPIDFAVGNRPTHSGPLSSRACYYMDPEGGWRVLGGALKVFPDLASAFASVGGPPPRVAVPGIDAQFGDVVPVRRVWYGWGCGTNQPLSRDAYSGIMLGLSMANRLVPDPSVQATTKQLIEQIVDFLLFHRWNVLLPPDNRIVTSTSFLGAFDKQLAYLRIGASIDPTHVPPGSSLSYQQRYDIAKAAAPVVWTQELMAVIDPTLGYFKFNLTQAALAPVLVYEQDPSVRAGYMAAHNLLWAKLKYHRNAYFSLLRILMQEPGQRASATAALSALTPSLTLGGEIRAVLAEWLRRRELVPGLNGLPRNTLANPVGTEYTKALPPSRLALYTGIDAGRRCLARAALPVWARPGYGMDFTWQKQPFELAIDVDVCRRALAGTPPTTAELLAWVHLKPDREGPGVDYLLAYWLARYLDVVPAT